MNLFDVAFLSGDSGIFLPSSPKQSLRGKLLLYVLFLGGGVSLFLSSTW